MVFGCTITHCANPIESIGTTDRYKTRFIRTTRKTNEHSFTSSIKSCTFRNGGRRTGCNQLNSSKTMTRGADYRTVSLFRVWRPPPGAPWPSVPSTFPWTLSFCRISNWNNQQSNFTTVHFLEYLNVPDEGFGHEKHCFDPQTRMDKVQVTQIFTQFPANQLVAFLQPAERR